MARKQELDLKAAEDSNDAEQENHDDHRCHGRHRDPPQVVNALAPDMRLASSIDASMRRNAGVMSMTLVERPVETKCTQTIPEKE
jgi:hypothetical protein